jgi:hypothetical protein
MKSVLNYTLFCISIILLFTVNHACAQHPERDEKWNDFYSFKWDENTRPFLEGNYGYGIPRHKLFEGEFERYGALEGKLGYSRINKFYKFVLDLDERYLEGSYHARDLNEFDSTVDTTNVRTEMLRFALGNRLGFGYDFWLLDVIPFQDSKFTFTKLSTERPSSLAPYDNEILERYEGSYRFGISTEGGFKVRVFKSISVIGSYEAAVIYPRVVFFKWLGGVIVQTFIVGGVSFFAEDIVDRSPLLGPIMYAVLRNAAAYGVYLGMRDKMNWPFNSETPLTHETFKLGVSFTF